MLPLTLEILPFTSNSVLFSEADEDEDLLDDAEDELPVEVDEDADEVDVDEVDDADEVDVDEVDDAVEVEVLADVVVDEADAGATMMGWLPFAAPFACG